jgi:tRNA nucleotidyltransferase (CCA-adding enzyme)
MKEALDVVMAWQLRNPDSTDAAAAIEAVKASQ